MADTRIAPFGQMRCPRCGEFKPRTAEFFYYWANREEWRLPCKACAFAARQKAYAADPEKFRERSRKHGAENAERKNAYGKSWRAALKTEMLTAYGHRCECCGLPGPHEFLTLEHVNRDGSEHRKRLGGQMQVYCELKRLGWPKGDYTLLCWNCQMASWHEGECPHARRRREEGGR